MLPCALCLVVGVSWRDEFFLACQMNFITILDCTISPLSPLDNSTCDNFFRTNSSCISSVLNLDYWENTKIERGFFSWCSVHGSRAEFPQMVQLPDFLLEAPFREAVHPVKPTFGGAMEKTITVPRKRRSGMMYAGPLKLEEDHKRSKLVHQTEETEEQSKEEYRQSLKAKWNRLSQKIILDLGAKEMAALCQELEVVGSSEDLSSVMHSGGTKPIGSTQPDILSLQGQVEELNARNLELETRIEEISEIAYIDAQSAKATELELESALQKSMALEKEIENIKNEDELQCKIVKQSTLIEYYETTVGDMKTRIDELEDRLAATSSKAVTVDSCGKAIQDDNSLNELRVDNRRLKAEHDRALSQLEVIGTQLDWEIEKKESAIGELMVLQSQKAVYDASKAELVELRKTKRTFEAGNAELLELRNLKRELEDERDELVELRCQKKTFEAAHAENELKAAEELQTTRRQKETLQAAIEEVSGLREVKATCEAVTEEHITALKRTKANFETAATEELAALRKQIAFFGTVAEELEELRKQKEMSKAEREELGSLRREIAILKAAESDEKSASFRDCESGMAAREKSLTAKVERLLQKQVKLVSNIKYLEGKRMEDKQEHGRHCLQLQEKEKEDKIHVLSEKEVLEVGKSCLLKEKQNLEKKWRQADQEVINLRLENERMEKAKTRVELESTALTRELFVKEAKTESLKAELRLKEEEETEQVRKLKEELDTVKKQLGAVAAAALCQICLENTRDAVLLPCAHMQSCVRCVKELIQREKSCPNCNRAISGFVFCNSDV